MTEVARQGGLRSTTRARRTHGRRDDHHRIARAAQRCLVRLDGLSERDEQVLAFERQWWKYAGAKESAIRELFDMSATRYYQVLNSLIDDPAALAHDPMLDQAAAPDALLAPACPHGPPPRGRLIRPVGGPIDVCARDTAHVVPSVDTSARPEPLACPA